MSRFPLLLQTPRAATWAGRLGTFGLCVFETLGKHKQDAGNMQSWPHPVGRALVVYHSNDDQLESLKYVS